MYARGWVRARAQVLTWARVRAQNLQADVSLTPTRIRTLGKFESDEVKKIMTDVNDGEEPTEDEIKHIMERYVGACARARAGRGSGEQWCVCSRMGVYKGGKEYVCRYALGYQTERACNDIGIEYTMERSFGVLM